MDSYVITTQYNLDLISRHCPHCLTTYFHCLNRIDDNREVHFTKEMVDIDMSEDWKRFRKNIKTLAREGLLTWHPFDDGIRILLTIEEDHGQ